MRYRVRTRRTLLRIVALVALVAPGALVALTGSACESANAGRRGWSPLVFFEANTSFRLGTAALPFAWSTAIGDLNADGRPDYAVADRIGRGASGFEYSVKFAVSGLAARSVTFDSPESALSISLRDVDHDQDLDVVVSTLISPTVVRVWLNDGRGVFAETARRDEAPEWRAGPSLATGHDDFAVAAVDAPPRRGGDALAAARDVTVDRCAASPATACDPARVFRLPAGRIRSRAPPAALRLL